MYSNGLTGEGTSHPRWALVRSLSCSQRPLAVNIPPYTATNYNEIKTLAYAVNTRIINNNSSVYLYWHKNYTAYIYIYICITLHDVNRTLSYDST